MLFDALDARVHEDEAKKKDLLYFEYGQIRLDGRTICEGARKMETRVLPNAASGDAPDTRYMSYAIEAVRVGDHARVRISDRKKRWNASSRCRTAPDSPISPSPANTA